MLGVDSAAFRQDVYSIVAAIPRGKVMSYGQIAELIGRPQNARLVGNVCEEPQPNLHFRVIGWSIVKAAQPRIGPNSKRFLLLKVLLSSLPDLWICVSVGGIMRNGPTSKTK